MEKPQTEYEPFWHVNTVRGRRVFDTPEDLLAAACEYFRWMDEHPFREQVLVSYKGVSYHEYVDKVRPYTVRGLQVFLGIGVSTLAVFRKDPAYAEAMEFIENVIYTQKFEYAAAGLLNTTMIVRDLGLADRSELTGKDGGPIEAVTQYQLPCNGRDRAADETDDG